MRVGFGLSMEQTQKLIMTNELRQAITVLQLNTLELSGYIEQELLENPLLEVKEETIEKEDVAETTKDEWEENEKFDVDWQEYFQDRSDLGYIRAQREQPAEFTYEHFLTEAPTLQEYLLFQLHVAIPEGKQRRIGEFLIGSLDDHGYMRSSLKEIATELKVTEDEVQDVLRVIQGFDPAGVGARDLKECLRIQLEQKGQLTPELEEFLQRHIEDLAAGRLTRIAQKLNLTVIEVQAMADVIKSLDPKPGRRFSRANDVRYIVPDVIVERIEGEYVILINDVSVPRLTVNSTYRSVLRQEGKHDPETRKFVENKLNAAAWLIKSIEQRRLTMYKVVNCLIELQREFLDKGVRYLKPLNLKHVADIIGMHESTVSRATSNKYVQTPQGVFELKFFFGSGVENTCGGDKTAAECIKRMIREMVEKEDPHNPLSDQRISDVLKEEGINISRRTVAKYRDEMGVLATPQRRRY